MSFTELSHYTEKIRSLHEIIPHDRDITKPEILLIKQYSLDALTAYMYYTYPKGFRQCEPIMEFICGCKRTYEQIPEGSTIIAPGDSPARVVKLIDLLFNTNCQIISFPLSSSYPKLSPKLIDDYMRQIIESNPHNLVYVDYIGSGSTYQLLLESFRRIYGDEQLGMQKINLSDTITATNFFIELISSAENINARHYPKYELEYSIGVNDMFRSNVLITYFYLIYDNGGKPMKYNYVDTIRDHFDFLEPTALYEISYYDVSHTCFQTKLISCQKLEFDVLCVSTISGEIEKIPLNTIISLTFRQRAYQHHIQKGIVSVKLIDGRQMCGYYSHEKLDVGDGHGSGYYDPFFDTIEVINDQPSALVDIVRDCAYEMEFYHNGQLSKEFVYITGMQYDDVEFIKQEHFVLHRQKVQKSWISKYLIHKLDKKFTRTIDCCGYGILKYSDHGQMYSVCDQWLIGEHYYENNDRTLKIVFPAIIEFNFKN
jgi:hypothetical protein